MPPAVQQVYFGSSAWPASFLGYLPSRDLGSSRYGYALRPSFSGAFASLP